MGKLPYRKALIIYLRLTHGLYVRPKSLTVPLLKV
jgi:hypothetical protein